MSDAVTAPASETRAPAAGCPVCAAPSAPPFFELPALPVYANVLWPTREQALGVSRGDLALSFCPECGHIYNRAFDPAKMDYTESYENSLHFSERFQQYAAGLADELVKRYRLRGGRVVEIGSGRGDFLRMLVERGAAGAAGYDPSYAPVEEDRRDPRVQLVQSYFGPEQARQPAALILARQTLEHIPAPGEFVAGLRDAVGEARTAVFFEVPNALYILRSLSVWDLIYEHVSFFSGPSLAAALEQGGFGPIRIAEKFAGQYLSGEGYPAEPGWQLPAAEHAARQAEIAELADDVESFVRRFQRKTAEWQAVLEQVRASGRRAVVWSAGSKGVMFLNMLDAGASVPYVVDINPRKHGMHISGAGQQIVPPEFLREYSPELIILMNPIYQEEIRQMARALGLEPEFLQA